MAAPYDLVERDGTTVSRIDIIDEAKNRKPCYCYHIRLEVSLKYNDFYVRKTIWSGAKSCMIARHLTYSINCYISSQYPLKACNV